MEHSVRKTIQEYALVSPGDRVLVALSGGADSTALLSALCCLGRHMGFSVMAAHLNHGIRSAGMNDATRVADLCRSLGVACVFGEEDVPAYAARVKAGLEEAGRELRYRFLRAAARRCGCNRIATAHHQQDQAETLIMRLARGTSVSGLRGIGVRELPFIRPLLHVQRCEVEEYLERHSIPWVEDESNADCCYTRNRVRHNLMPVLETVHPQAQKHIAQLAQHVSLEEEYWTDEVNKILRGATFSAEEVRVPYADLAQLHPALRLRVLRAALGRVRGDLLGLKSRHLHALDSIFSSSRPQMQFDLPGAWVARRYAEVVFRRTPPHCCASDYLIPLDGPGTYPLPDGSKVVVEICAQVRGENHFCLELEGDKVIWPLYIRNNRRGDRVKCVGMAGSKKLKDLFSERHIILERRKSVPLLCNAQGEILWVIGIRRSRLWHCTPRSHRVVRVVFTPAGSKI